MPVQVFEQPPTARASGPQSMPAKEDAEQAAEVSERGCSWVVRPSARVLCIVRSLPRRG